MQRRTILGLIAGAAAGLVAWLLIQETGWFHLILSGVDSPPARTAAWLQAALGGVYGLTIAVSVALAGWPTVDSKAARMRTLSLGAVSGVVGGMIGIVIAQWVYSALLPSQTSLTQSQILEGALARAMSWAIIGLAIGGAQGITRMSARAASLGAVGGFLGGFVGGGVFEALELETSNPALARLCGFVFVGAAIGFFVELIPYIFKHAWIRIEHGRGEGKEYRLEKTWTTIGRSELADISLFGNRDIAPTHFLIEVGPSLARLRPVAVDGELALVKIDGKPIKTDTLIVGGEKIEIGDRVLGFYTKSSAEKPVLEKVAEPKVGLAHAKRNGADKIPAAAFAKTAAAEPLKPAEVGAVAAKHTVAEDGLTGTRLSVVQGPYYGQIFALAGPRELSIGRAPDRDIPLTNDPAVSRHHATIMLHAGRHVIEDLKSANGTFVSEIQLEPHHPKQLWRGDTIKIGDTIFRYE